MHRLSNLRPGSLILKLKFHHEANMWFWEERKEESIALVRKLIIVNLFFFFRSVSIQLPERIIGISKHNFIFSGRRQPVSFSRLMGHHGRGGNKTVNG